jgi:hypothetical protein
VAGFGISRFEPSGSAIRELISMMELRKIGCEDGSWMELAQDYVQWQALLLAVMTLHVYFHIRDVEPSRCATAVFV